MSKQTNKLTAKTVKNLKHTYDGSNKHADGGGLYLFTHRNGSKYWRMDYRHPISQKRQTLALGVYAEKGGVSLEQARIKRDDAKRLLSQGIDPAEQRKEAKAAQKNCLENTFAKFATEWLRLREHEQRVDSENERKLNHDILPFIGKMPVITLTTEQLEQDVTSRIVERGALETARRVKTIMAQILDLPFKRKIIPFNPARHITTPKPIKNNFNAIIDEKDTTELLKAAWKYKANFPRALERTELLIKLSAYAFQRPGEMRGLLWESVDFEKRQLSFISSKTKKPHIVPLSRQAYDILERLSEVRKQSIYVFPSNKTNSDCLSETTVREALIRMGFKGKHTAHGFRAMAKTLLKEEIEYHLDDAVELQLAHNVKDSNGTAYNRTQFLNRRRELMQIWADYLDTLRQGGDVSVFKPKQSNVIQFGRVIA